MSQKMKAIDCMVSVAAFETQEVAERTSQKVGYLFRDLPARAGTLSIEQLVQMMDEQGLEKAILTTYSAESKFMIEAIEKYPDRFVGAQGVNPHEGMEAVRKLERAVKEHGIKAAQTAAFRVQKPYNDKIYFPIFSKCIELDIPIRVTVGIPGPKVPGEVQNPIYLDEVCYLLPELKIVMAHGGEPWTFTCVKLMLKWDNLYFQTSAFAPQHYPEEIIHYANTRGSHKIMFATGYPLIDIKRAMSELGRVPFKEDVRRKVLWENAMKLYKLGS